MPEPARPSGNDLRPPGGFFGWLRSLAAVFVRAMRPAAETAAPREDHAAQDAAEALALALAENDPVPRLARLRAALALCERLQGEAGDIMVLEASLHLGERLRALGERGEALAHFGRAVERSFRVPDPVGRQRRAGVLSRLAILDQETGDVAQARQRYEEALALGRDADGPLLLGMLTQAAFNLGLLESETGDDERAVRSWERAIELGSRAAHPSGWDPAAVAAFNLGHLYARRGEAERARAARGRRAHRRARRHAARPDGVRQGRARAGRDGRPRGPARRARGGAPVPARGRPRAREPPARRAARGRAGRGRARRAEPERRAARGERAALP